MEQLSHTVAQNSERAREASKTSDAVAHAAVGAGEVIAAANGAMDRISTSSSKISNIIGMIDDIAFQTNLLALNASVEAARAGDAGKGFAVVAVEVRRLAQSAAGASAEVKTLIEQSSTEVTSGTRLVGEAVARIEKMQETIRTSRDLVLAIAEETTAQAGTINEVASAIRTLDEMTQHNAALVEETNAAIEQTEQQTEELSKAVRVFTTSSAQADSGVRRRRAAA
jgi:methyl-accepting chemotaxis protein